MFSMNELVTAKSWAEIGKQMLTDQLQSPIFTHNEKEAKRREYATLDSFVEEVKLIQRECVHLDADQIVHMLGVCTRYSEYVKAQCENGNMSCEDYAFNRYTIGYVQARLEVGIIKIEETDMIYEWEQTLG